MERLVIHDFYVLFLSYRGGERDQDVATFSGGFWLDTLKSFRCGYSAIFVFR